MPPFFIGTAIDIPSGISCKHIAIANDKPNFIEASNPDPIANPSGKLCSARPMLTIIPVFSNEFLFLCFILNFLSTSTSQIIITIIPNTIPINTFNIPVKLNASGIKSKHTIEIISPDANASIKLKNFLDVFLTVTPIIPPIVVPNVPKNNHISVVFSKLFIFSSPLYCFYTLYQILITDTFVVDNSSDCFSKHVSN